jgi:NAD(P)-dependent dehydrogenase (short-subunit alcohol dehydrogenase family)
MREQRSGAIINVASTAARTGLPLRTAYVASMSGLLGLTLNAARELGPDNIRCNAVLPGIVDDEQGRQLIAARARHARRSTEEAEAELLRHTSMRTWIAPEDVADTVLFLASDSARHISGQNLGVCGNLEWEG